MRGLLEKEEAGFVLSFVGKGGRAVVVPVAGGERLVGGLGMRGRVLVVFRWVGDGGEGVGPVLKREFGERARELVVEDVGAGGGSGEGGEGAGDGVGDGLGVGGEKATAGGKGSARKGGVPKWLKLPGKK